MLALGFNHVPAPTWGAERGARSAQAVSGSGSPPAASRITVPPPKGGRARTAGGRGNRQERRAAPHSAEAALPTLTSLNTSHRNKPPTQGRTKRAKSARGAAFIASRALARVGADRGFWRRRKRRGMWPEPRPARPTGMTRRFSSWGRARKY